MTRARILEVTGPSEEDIHESAIRIAQQMVVEGTISEADAQVIADKFRPGRIRPPDNG